MSRGDFFEVTRNLPCRSLSLSEAVVDRDAPVGVPGQEKPWKRTQEAVYGLQASLVANLVLRNGLLVSIYFMGHRLSAKTQHLPGFAFHQLNQFFICFAQDLG